MKNRLFSILVLIQLQISAGNNPVLSAARVDFKTTNEAYAKLNGLSMDTYYMVFDDHHAISAIEGKNGKYVKYGLNEYTRIDDIETYAIGDKLISINAENKQITVGDNKAWSLSPLQTNIDSLLTLCDDIKVEKTGANEKRYKLFLSQLEGSEFSRIDVFIDTKNSRYVKVVLYYNTGMNLSKDFYAEEKQPRLEILYKNFKLLESEPDLFKQELYVLNVNGKLKPAPKYFNYKVVDLRNETNIRTPKKNK